MPEEFLHSGGCSLLDFAAKEQKRSSYPNNHFLGHQAGQATPTLLLFHLAPAKPRNPEVWLKSFTWLLSTLFASSKKTFMMPSIIFFLHSLQVSEPLDFV